MQSELTMLISLKYFCILRRTYRFMNLLCNWLRYKLLKHCLVSTCLKLPRTCLIHCFCQFAKIYIARYILLFCRWSNFYWQKAARWACCRSSFLCLICAFRITVLSLSRRYLSSFLCFSLNEAQISLAVAVQFSCCEVLLNFYASRWTMAQVCEVS